MVPGARHGPPEPVLAPESFSPGVDALDSRATGDEHILEKTGEQRGGGGVRTRRLVRMGEVEVKRG